MRTALKHRSDAGSSGIGGTGFQITKRDEAFDVDVKWVQALMDGDQSLSGLLNRRRGDHWYVHVQEFVRKSDNSEILYVRESGHRSVHIF